MIEYAIFDVNGKDTGIAYEDERDAPQAADGQVGDHVIAREELQTREQFTKQALLSILSELHKRCHHRLMREIRGGGVELHADHDRGWYEPGGTLRRLTDDANEKADQIATERRNR